jgi:hypothetical protein
MTRTAGTRAALGIAVALALAMALPAIASAGGGERLELRLRGADGYHITVRGGGPNVSLTATREVHLPANHASYTVYLARARARPPRIEATFQGLGHVAMRFHPSGWITRSRPGRDCWGPDRTTTRYGVFVGSLSFRGEGGYTSARVERAKGTVTTPARVFCISAPRGPGRSRGGAARRLPRTSFRAAWRLGVSALSFEAYRDRNNGARFAAICEQTSGQVAILRVAFAQAPARSFAAGSALVGANLSPPAPFSGTGFFRREPNGAKIWSGPLAVTFPGAPDVPLTGTQFKTQLTRSW